MPRWGEVEGPAGCRVSHFRTFGCLWVASLSTTASIAFRAGTFVSTVLRKRMNLMPVALHVAADDGAVEDVEGGEHVVVPWRL